MADKKATHIVNHAKLYLTVGGILTHVEAGAKVALSEKDAKDLGARVLKLGKDSDTVQAGSSKADAKKDAANKPDAAKEVAKAV